MKQSKVEETKVEKTENGQVTVQTEEVKETSEVKTEITAADQSEQKAAEKTEKAEEVKNSEDVKQSGNPDTGTQEPEKTEKETKAETEPVKERKRRKSKFFLLLVTEKEDGVIRQHHIGSTAIELAGIVLFLVIVLVVCRLIYDSITLQNMHQEMISQISQINTLTDENESLTVENATLNSKITVLSETVSKKMATEDAISQEESENAMPKGFPLSGTATMEEATDSEEHPMLEFTAADGVNIVSTGTGVVLSIDADEQYGNKIVIDHGNGYQSIYRNNGTPLVKTGETLGKGYILFTVGEDNTKLGYEIMQNEEYIDPMTLIEING